jgi:hypothetical protein
MKRKDPIQLLLVLMTICLAEYVYATDPDSLSSKHINQSAMVVSTEEHRTFNSLDSFEFLGETDPIVANALPADDSATIHRNKALEYNEDVMRRNAVISNLNALSTLQLPVGIVNHIADLRYTIIISKIEVTPSGSFLEAYAMLEFPGTVNKIAFRGTKIPFSNNGGLQGSGRLELIGDYEIAANSKTLLRILGKGNSFVEFDCGGFKSVGIEAEVEVSRDFLVPEDEQGKVIAAPARVKTKFSTQATSFNDLLIAINLPAFQINGLKNFSFNVQQAYLDWSDTANPSGLIFPQNYQSPFVQGGQPNLWHGFYLQKLQVKLPPSFATRSSKNRTALNVERMLIDEQGFTGSLSAEKIITDGSMEGWPYTLDRLAIDLVSNSVKGFELSGSLTVPKLKDSNGSDAMFSFDAIRNADGNYNLAVKIDNALNMPFLLAELSLAKGSSIVVIEKDDKFFPTAMLSGSLSIKSSGKGIKAGFVNIGFEGMRISTEAPKFDIQSLSLGAGKQRVSGFPVSFSNIGIKRSGEDKLGIGFDLKVTIAGDSSESFGGSTRLVVWGKEKNENSTNAEGQVVDSGSDAWVFDKIEVDAIQIQAKKPGAYELTGSVNFFSDDAVYGDGFKGELTASIGKFGGLRALTIFGRTDSYRYWYADALVTLSTAIPLIPGTIFASGFGGGYYSRMKQTTTAPSSKIALGKSGIYYVPDENTSGARAIMNIQTARKEAMNGNVSFEIEMNKRGGVNSIALNGNANFMSFAELAESKIKELASASVSGKLSEKLSGLTRGQVFGSLSLKYNNVTDCFHGTMDVYVNVAGGLLRGVNDGNLAGHAEIHFEQNNWHVYLGTPDTPIGLEVAKIFRANSYMMLGLNLPGSPPPPKGFSEINGNVNMDYMRDLNALNSGMGYAFGLNFGVDTGDLSFLMFYGRFAAEAGIDFMLKNYGNTYCDGSADKLGINGWYANGQAYAYMLAKIGVKVNLKFYHGNFEILNMYAAAIMQAKGPNPFWMQGTVSGYFNILNGLVKGSCNFQVTVGKECKMNGDTDLLSGLNIISQVTPADNANRVSVFNTPQIAFNMALGQTFVVPDLDDNKHSFQAVLEQFDVLDGNEKIKGNLIWNADNTVVVFDGRDLLPGNKKLQIKVKVLFQEYKNGIWETVKVDNAAVEETASTTFTTDNAPDIIPPENIVYSYPKQGQINFYPLEYSKGFIQLKDGQPYLFAANSEWDQVLQFTDAATGSIVTSALSYNSIDKRVNFDIPLLKNSQIFKLEIVNKPRKSLVVDENVRNTTTNLSQTSGDTITLVTKTVTGTVSNVENRIVYRNNFRVSKFNTFTQKVSQIKIPFVVRQRVDVDEYFLQARLNGEEVFDDLETNVMDPFHFIHFEAVTQSNNWYNTYVYPTVYDGIPLLGFIRIKNRDPKDFGIPPIKNVVYFSNTQIPPLSEEQTSFTPQQFTYQDIKYNMPLSVAGDYDDLKTQAVNYLADHASSATKRTDYLILNPSPWIRQGDYKVKLSYNIPGLPTPTSSAELVITNSVQY